MNEPKVDYIFFDWKGTLVQKEQRSVEDNDEKKKNKLKQKFEHLLTVIEPELRQKILERSKSRYIEKYHSKQDHLNIEFEGFFISMENEKKILLTQENTIEKEEYIFVKKEKELINNLFVSMGFDKDFEYLTTKFLSYVHPETLFPDAIDLLKYLKQKNIHMSLVRNANLSSEQMKNRLSSNSVEDFFDHIICSGEVGAEKPEKRFFEQAVKIVTENESFSLNSPQKIWMVGNEIEADILGAKGMGWKTALLQSTEKDTEGVSDWRVNSLTELKQHFVDLLES